MPSLIEFVDPGAARIDVPADDWRDAITAAGDLLIHSGVAGESYTAAMISNVEQHGPYIVIAPGFAFAHSRADASVTRTGMSIVRLARPVEFGNAANDPVHLVLALAAVDANAHQDALATLAQLLSNPERRQRLDEAATDAELRAALGDDTTPTSTAPASPSAAAPAGGGALPGASTPSAAATTDEGTVPSKGFILTVCGNGLGTSLFLKNTLEQVLDGWGWMSHMRVEATDTISAKGRAKEADLLLTSGAIAEALGDLGVPVEVVDDFTSQRQVDAALRRVYAV